MYCRFFAASFKIHSLSFLYLFYNLSPMIDFDSLKTENGLILAIVQDQLSKEVLMCAYMNREALEKTVETGIAHFWSRSRQQLWKKGETSGHVQKVKEIRIDCDMDSLLMLVEQTGFEKWRISHFSFISVYFFFYLYSYFLSTLFLLFSFILLLFLYLYILFLSLSVSQYLQNLIFFLHSFLAFFF